VQTDIIIVRIEGEHLYSALRFLDGNLDYYYIEYELNNERIEIIGADIGFGVDFYYYMDENDKEKTKESIDFETPENKDLLAKFNKTAMTEYRDKVLKRQIGENDTKQMLLVLLDYLDEITKGGIFGLTEKIRRIVKNESVRVNFEKPEIIKLNISEDNK